MQGAYGQNDDATQSYARLVMAGAGVMFARHDPKLRGRLWTSLRAGLVYHRQRQETTNDGEVGHFVGLEVSVGFGYDAFGAMYTRAGE